MTKKEALNFGEDRLGLFGGKMDQFIEVSLKAIEETNKCPEIINCKDCKYRKITGSTKVFLCLYWGKLTVPEAYCSNGIKVKE